MNNITPTAISIIETQSVQEDEPAVNLWQAQWRVDVGNGCEVGITVDDGTFVVLYPYGHNRWRPGKHIPVPVAQKLGELARSPEGV